MGKFDNDMLIVPSLDMIVIRQVGDDTGGQPANQDRRAVCLGGRGDQRSQSLAQSAGDADQRPSGKSLSEFAHQPADSGDPRRRRQQSALRAFAIGHDLRVAQRPGRLRAEGVSRSRTARPLSGQGERKGLSGDGLSSQVSRERTVLRLLHAQGHRQTEHRSRISRFRVSKDDPNRADPDCEERLLAIEHPFWNHKGGTLAFGPDGYLYIAVGDGGLANDPYGNGQNLKTLLAKILRIDVDHHDPGKKYAVPKDNPFADQGDKALGEIWAYGLRNPWRIAFDRQTGTLWCADVGQDLWEEIDIITKGGNYGWRLREGVHRFGPKGSDPRSDLIEPIWEYHHDIGKSVTGGHVYRGKKLPQLAGCYLHADYVSGKVWALKVDDKFNVVANYAIQGNVSPIMSFGEDEQGEVYYTTDGGQIYRFRETADK